MKVTVTFGDTVVVVPCKDGWTVGDLVDQATRRYLKILEQHGGRAVRIRHVEYSEGGILDLDDPLSDLVEDKDKLVAVFDEVPREQTSSPGSGVSNGHFSRNPSPEPLQYTPHYISKQPNRGEIEVNEAILKINTPLLVRSSSDSALAPPLETSATPPPDDPHLRASDMDVSYVLKGAPERLRTEQPSGRMGKVNFSTLTKTVEFSGDKGPLGIHVVPYCSSLSGRSLGLLIKGIEEHSRSRRDGIFQVDECIVQINNIPLLDKTFAKSQEVFRQVLGSPLVQLEVLPVSNKQRYEKSLIGQLFTGDVSHAPLPNKSPLVLRSTTTTTAMATSSGATTRPEAKQGPPKPQVRSKTPEPVNPATEDRGRTGSTERAPSVSPTPLSRASPPIPQPPPASARSQSPQVTKSPGVAGLAALTRKAGKKIKIDLKKGSEGLGFTVVTRDPSIHRPGPILVKNILPRGAAIRDGRLQPGDRILEVNSVDMTERTQEELVAMLRSTKQGESVFMVVARPEEGFLPRELKGEEAGSLVLEDGREQLMFEIPLNDTGSAGLGVSLKGNKSRETGEDLGIFIKSVIHGGAAHKDGRLRVNDQLLAVNGEPLLGRSNHTAMETLRHSMSSEGNARGTIQLVLLRPAPQMTTGLSGGCINAAANGNQEPYVHDAAVNQVSERHAALQPGGLDGPPARQGLQGPSAYSNATASELMDVGRDGWPSVANNGNAYRTPANAAFFPVATNGGQGRYGDSYGDGEEEEDWSEDFPPPPSPGAVAEMNRDMPLTHPQNREMEVGPYTDDIADGQLARDTDLNTPRNRTSKSMDLVADESNVGSLVGPATVSNDGGVLGPTLGLWKSSSLESLQTAVSEARQSHTQDPVPFHRPRPQNIRGRSCNQSFRLAIDKSYEGPSEDDDDLSEPSSGRDTPASGSSRQDLDAEDDKKTTKKKTKGKKKEKKSKGRRKGEDPPEDPEKKTKKKGFGLLRFGKKKEEKSKEASRAAKAKLEALSEEELERTADHRVDPRQARLTPELRPMHSMDDDDSDPNYARINDFRQPPSPRLHGRQTPSPGATGPPSHQPVSAPPGRQLPPEDLDGLYAKVNKHRAPAPQLYAQPDSERRLQGQHRDAPPSRLAPAYEELDAARRRVPEYDPQRMAPRGDDPRPAPPYEDLDRPHGTHPRRKDPYDYPAPSRPQTRDPAPYPSSHEQRGRPPLRQDVPPYHVAANQRGTHHPYETVAEVRGANSRTASLGRYISPGRHPTGTGHYAEPACYASPERYDYRDEERRPERRQKNPLIGAV